jgi:aminoglycoside phosphotransferase (APT) family kinase protein
VSKRLDPRGGGRDGRSRRDVMLAQSEIAGYLQSLGLIKPGAVVEDGLTVVDASRRNCVFIATTRAGPTYVVKQAGPRSARTLGHEAIVLRMLEHAPELAGRVPTVVHEDRELCLLVLRSPAGARDFARQHMTGRFPSVPARALGRDLATLHGLDLDGLQGPDETDRMWGLTLAEPPHRLVLDLSITAQDLVSRLQGSEAMIDRLKRVEEVSYRGAFVHGDVRWENCLATAAPGSQRRTRVLLVDWELAGPGDPGLDVGTVFGEYLSAWVGSIPIVEIADPGRLLSQAKYPLRRMQPAINAFWSAYCRASSSPPALRRVVELAAIRLLQTAVERAQVVAAPSAHLVLLLQLADNILQEPDAAASTLLGLRE